jgi:hypothetical protein
MTIIWGTASASFTLKRALKKQGFNAQVVEGEMDVDMTKETFPNQFLGQDHCWLQFKNYIIDITATQFNVTLPKVTITTTKDCRYKSERIVPTMKDLGWDFGQTPTRSLVAKILKEKQ